MLPTNTDNKIDEQGRGNETKETIGDDRVS